MTAVAVVTATGCNLCTLSAKQFKEYLGFKRTEIITFVLCTYLINPHSHQTPAVLDEFHMGGGFYIYIM